MAIYAVFFPISVYTFTLIKFISSITALFFHINPERQIILEGKEKMLIETGVFILTAALMLLGTVLFVWWFAPTREGELLYYAAPSITLIAGVAYGLMALSSEGILGPLVLEARYVDWVITTPLIVYVLAAIAGADRQTKYRAMTADAVMIALGYVASTTTGLTKWAFFFASSGAFTVLIYYLVTALTEAASNRPPAVEAMFVGLRDLTVFLWVAFPFLWLLSPFGFGVVTFADYHFLIALMDVTAKMGFNLIIALRTRAITDVLGQDSLGETVGDPSSRRAHS